MLNKYLKPISIMLVMFALTACGADVKIKTSLQGTKDVSEGETVYLDNQVVGEVTDVSRSGGKTHIEIELDNNGITAVMSDAAIVVNRLKESAPLEIHNRQGSTKAVEDGQELQGLDSMFQLGAWMVGDSIDLGAGAISDYVSAFQKYLQGDEWQKDKEQIAHQAQEAAKAAEVAVAGAGQELSKVMEEIKKAEEPMAQAVEQLGTELAPVIGELGKSGQSIIRELEKLTQNLEQQTNEGDRQVGSRFFESLNKTLETINQSMEKSLETEDLQTTPLVAPSEKNTLNVDVPEEVVVPGVDNTPQVENMPETKEPLPNTSGDSFEKELEEAIEEAKESSPKVKL